MLSDGEISYLYDGFGRFEQVTKADGSITHVINGEEKESGELPQEDVQSRVLNYYEYDAFGNTIRCEEQVRNRFRYTGEQYDILTGQYYLRARYYNPVIARFTQEDTYYGDGLNLYTYCQNNPVLYHDPTGHGTKENSPYSREEQQYIDAGADPDTARLAAECYPDAKSKQDLYNKYKSQGYNAADAKKLANYEIVHGEERAKNYAANNVKKSGPDYTATFPRDNVNTDWRTQERVNAQRNAGAGKGNESGNKSGTPSGFYQDANGRWHRPNGQFASNTEVGIVNNSEHYLHRSYIRQSTIDAVNSNTKVNYKTGQIYDEISRKWVNPSNVELGHTTGNEYWYWRNWAESQGMTQSQFNEFMNNPDFYRWQDIISNRSHIYEDPH